MLYRMVIPSNNSFPVIAIALIGILATAFLLIAYYVFVIKCCLNWHRIDFLNRFTHRERTPDGLTSSPNGVDESKGLDESIIRLIPVIKFRKLVEQRREKSDVFKEDDNEVIYECAVCLSEFEHGERLRVIPNCCHAFHIDCIDIWLQSSANCPLCRTGISPSSVVSSLPNTSNLTTTTDSFIGNDDDYVVIEIQGNNLDDPRLVVSTNGEQSQGERNKKGNKFDHMGSVGDEWIELRGKDYEFGDVQTIRRSFSMDLSVDREFSLEIEQCCRKGVGEISCQSQESCCSSGSSSSSSKVRRSIFSFGYGRSSRGSVQPLQLDP